MFRRFTIPKWVSKGYWFTLLPMMIFSVVGGKAIMHGEDLDVYFRVYDVQLFNIHWVEVFRQNERPDNTFLLVNEPGTKDKEHMRVLEYVTRDLAAMGDAELKDLIQRDTEASMAGGYTRGSLVDMTPERVDRVMRRNLIDLLLLLVTKFAVTDVIFFAITYSLTYLKTFVKGKWRKRLDIYTVCVKADYFISFMIMSVALVVISYPVTTNILKYLLSFF